MASLASRCFVPFALLLCSCALPEATLGSGKAGGGGTSDGGGASGSGGAAGSGGSSGGTAGTGGTSTGGTSGFCGNGKIDGVEHCDGSDLGNATCASVVSKPASGSLGCKGDCSFDTSNCVYCGNGKIEAGEICDSANVGSYDCKVVAASAVGTIACRSDCQLDTSGCTPQSANGDLSQYEAGAPWPMFRGGPFHAARTSIIRSKQLNLAWKFPGGQLPTAPAVGGDGTIYFGATDSTNASYLYALNPDGTQKWKLGIAAAVRGTPAIAADGTIYAVAANGTLYSVSHQGKQNWLYPTGAQSLSAPTIGVDGRVLFGANDGKLRAIDKNGSLSWAYTAGAGGDYSSTYSVAVALDGKIYVPESKAGGTHLYVLSKDGVLVGTATNNPMTECSATIGIDGTVYFAGNAYNPDGTNKWTAQAWGWWGVTLGGDGSLYAGGSGPVTIFKPSDGSVAWTSQPVGPGNTAPPLVAGDGVLFGGGWDADYVWSLTPFGAVNDQKTIGDNVMDTPSIGLDGTLYFGSLDGNLYAYSP